MLDLLWLPHIGIMNKTKEVARQYEWHSYCSSIWKYDNQCFWDALWLSYSTCVHNYGGTFAQVTNWTMSQVGLRTARITGTAISFTPVKCFWSRQPSRFSWPPIANRTGRAKNGCKQVYTAVCLVSPCSFLNVAQNHCSGDIEIKIKIKTEEDIKKGKAW